MLKQIGTQAKDAAAEIAVLSTDKKNKIFRDFAHSPSKLMATINAVKLQYSDKLLSVYELHSSSSFDFTFLKNYKDTLDKSDFSVIYISENNLKKFSKEIDPSLPSDTSFTK